MLKKPSTPQERSYLDIIEKMNAKWQQEPDTLPDAEAIVKKVQAK